MNNYGIIIDLETGGLDPQTCAVTEIAAIAFNEKNGSLVEVKHFHSLVKPPEYLDITREAAFVQGVTVEDLWNRDAPTEAEALFGIGEMLCRLNPESASLRRWAYRIFAHNAPFDQAFLTEMVRRNSDVLRLAFLEQPTLLRFSCTLQLFQQQRMAGLWPDMPDVMIGGSLTQLCESWGIERKEPHDALSDCRATLQVLDRLQKRMKGQRADGTD